MGIEALENELILNVKFSFFEGGKPSGGEMFTMTYGLDNRCRYPEATLQSVVPLQFSPQLNAMAPAHLRFYALVDSPHAAWKVATIRRALLERTGASVEVVAECCFHVVLEEGADLEEFERCELQKLEWLLAPSPFDGRLTRHSQLSGTIKEIGPRLTFKTAYCTNALSALSAAGVRQVSRLERTTRYQFVGAIPDDETLLEIAGDRMTECIYTDDVDFTPIKGRENFIEIDVLGDPTNLDKANEELGLAFDKHDMLYYKDLFLNKLKRNPTDVELFDLAQSDSEHSRHWFFRGKLFVDGKERKDSITNPTPSRKRDVELADNNVLLIIFDVEV
ncbi:hypothetical protein ANCCEY_07991 [Ancylostoma ceylanicum]|uniref:Phosphoribosylformylglycinamidine synthase linker domain-containing protein n=1 Tax=Ancylostoma ceylanicum TaxID=53326 RepID=A0A0D6LLG8_9BILA|nr:hypothetical protein ANCCEY_07991 [Ancylostoma ceylanicum]